ncbi:phosphonate ABC transporter ATP-binding protein [Methylophaga sp.]|uniref:phosphonate ABC transporter ATP-binding protein n=1 Tax=Methylophaga sp. TaxID=2024840 RepID=UPI003F6A36BC
MKAVGDKTPILKIENLKVRYSNNVVALRDTTLSFFNGEFVVLLGLSGAGKSSLLRSLNHLVIPTSGQVISSSHGPLNSDKVLRKHRQTTAMVFQQHQLILKQTVLQNILMGRLANHSFFRSLLPLPKADLDIALHSLERVGLSDKAMTRVDQLSGGQQQRVGIARALAQKPDIILADEPIASLDPATSQKILELLKRICEEDDITAIVSLHQLDFARQFADRIIGLANAEVVFDAKPAQLDASQLSRIYSSKKPEPNTDKEAMYEPRPLVNITST